MTIRLSARRHFPLSNYLAWMRSCTVPLFCLISMPKLPLIISSNLLFLNRIYLFIADQRVLVLCFILLPKYWRQKNKLLKLRKEGKSCQWVKYSKFGHISRVGKCRNLVHFLWFWLRVGFLGVTSMIRVIPFLALIAYHPSVSWNRVECPPPWSRENSAISLVFWVRTN